MGICSLPFTPTPPNPYTCIFVGGGVWWLMGQAGYPGFCMASNGNYQTSQNYFCSLETICIRRKVLFVCFGVLRPSQHYLSYFWAGQFTYPHFLGRLIHKWLTSTVHILSPETDNCPSWISGRERMTPQKNVAPAVFKPATWNWQKKNKISLQD